MASNSYYKFNRIMLTYKIMARIKHYSGARRSF